MPAQHQQQQPGTEAGMAPRPRSEDPEHRGSGKLDGKVALITGGDSGIGRAVALAFAKEGADIAIAYLEEDHDAGETRAMVEQAGGRCLLLRGDLGDSRHAAAVVDDTVAHYGKLDVLVNNAAEQHPLDTLAELEDAQLEATFRTNVFAMFYVTRAAMRHLVAGTCIINTTSVTAYRGSPHLLDYAATKGAIVAFTRSLAGQVVEKGIRVNGVAPGPIWTPLIPSTFSAEEVARFGTQTPMGRPGQPDEVAGAYVFLASRAASYITGQVVHVNGGEIVNG
ncbi:SDR family oxidoreductase [Cupriavidus sp. 30B13]|uniref:SDR family oxidoreductase n=1 Tax=Cupriavidus sp. 30B13 TaxID=3384241 RepID=UPI003CF1D515